MTEAVRKFILIFVGLLWIADGKMKTGETISLAWPVLLPALVILVGWKP